MGSNHGYKVGQVYIEFNGHLIWWSDTLIVHG